MAKIKAIEQRGIAVESKVEKIDMAVSKQMSILEQIQAATCGARQSPRQSVTSNDELVILEAQLEEAKNQTALEEKKRHSRSVAEAVSGAICLLD